MATTQAERCPQVDGTGALSTEFALTFEREGYVGAEKAATLTDAQVLTALNFIHGSDTESEKRAFVRGLVK